MSVGLSIFPGSVYLKKTFPGDQIISHDFPG
jgi:hypothetical protein